MKLFARYAALLSLCLLVPASLLAQVSGCVDESPESPTIVLGLIGGAYAAYRYARVRIGARNR